MCQKMTFFTCSFLFCFVFVFTVIPSCHSVENLQQQCNETCGSLQVRFPFYINNASCGWSESLSSDIFQLSCLNSSTLFLNLNTQFYRVLEFFTDGILVDFPGLSNTCRPYNDLNSFGFRGNEFFGISNDNVIGLYDCEDSSLCKANCEATVLPGCSRNGNGNENGPDCCYPLSDHSVWHVGDEFSVFSKYECRGFSCWVVPKGTSSGKRGVKLEWAVPANSTQDVCAENARSVNASTIRRGIRCICDDGFVGDGYGKGSGCLKSCFKDGKEAYGKDCEPNRHSKRKTILLAGLLASFLATTCLIALVFLLRRTVTSTTFNLHQHHFRTTLSFRKPCNTRLFALTELEEATKGFSEEQKLMQTSTGTVYSGILKDGSHIAIQKVHCQNEKDLMQILSRVEILSTILHHHLAHILGCCIDSGYTPMIVYEFPENGSLDEHLQKGKDQKLGLDWYKRLSIATQTAGTLAFLQHEISPPIFHRDLNSGSIFLEEFSVKIACFGLVDSNSDRSDVYDMGVLLLEIVTGSKHNDLPSMALQKVKDGKLEEILDPLLYYHDQPPFRREQIEIVTDIATRCLLFGPDGKLSIMDVARELMHITKESIDGGSKRGPELEETFSNSSLLQMISMSPDSLYIP